MARARDSLIFICGSCGNETLKWEGRCPGCGEWNTLAEIRRDRRDGRGDRLEPGGAPALELADVSTDETLNIKLSSAEVNRVLGGGIVPGSLTLLAGDPGIGKSTLLLRSAADVAEAEGTSLYISGEESPAQVRMRADRLGIQGRGLYIVVATDIDVVLAHLQEHRPALVVVDSVQTLHDDSVSSEPGSIAQIKESTRRLTEWAKSNDIPIIMSGHVTKGGDIAGPRVLEHMVDVVLYMEGDPLSSYRLLKATKNRFGSTNEIGVLVMTDRGLVDVEDPSKAFLSERSESAVGSVVAAIMEGSRPLLVEIQALTSPSVLHTSRRVATGIDFNRLLLSCAVLARRASVPTSNQDVVVNVAGGLRVREPAADLALGLAIASSVRNTPADRGLAAIGEVGLTGEVRRVPQLDRRLGEVARMGLQRCLVPGNQDLCGAMRQGVEVVPVDNLGQAVRASIQRR